MKKASLGTTIIVMLFFLVTNLTGAAEPNLQELKDVLAEIKLNLAEATEKSGVPLVVKVNEVNKIEGFYYQDQKTNRWRPLFPHELEGFSYPEGERLRQLERKYEELWRKIYSTPKETARVHKDFERHGQALRKFSIEHDALEVTSPVAPFYKQRLAGVEELHRQARIAKLDYELSTYKELQAQRKIHQKLTATPKRGFWEMIKESGRSKPPRGRL